MSKQTQLLQTEARTQYRPRTTASSVSTSTSSQKACPICGGMVEQKEMGTKSGWTCLVGGYAHYYQARYGHLKRWFTSGKGNLREPVIQAMDCVAPTP